MHTITLSTTQAIDLMILASIRIDELNERLESPYMNKDKWLSNEIRKEIEDLRASHQALAESLGIA